MESKLSSICTKPLEMVTGIRAGELRESDPERPSVIIRAKRGEETLWDIAKVCGSTVSAIQRLNKLDFLFHHLSNHTQLESPQIFH